MALTKHKNSIYFYPNIVGVDSTLQMFSNYTCVKIPAYNDHTILVLLYLK